MSNKLKKIFILILAFTISIILVKTVYLKDYAFLFPSNAENLISIEILGNEEQDIYYRDKENIKNIMTIFRHYKYRRTFFVNRNGSKRLVLLTSGHKGLGHSITLLDNHKLYINNKDYIIIKKDKSSKTLYDELDEYIK
jgi:hypothetical protein